MLFIILQQIVYLVLQQQNRLNLYLSKFNMTLIRQEESIIPTQQILHKGSSLQSVTILLIFLIIVINQIFLISLIAILLKKIKFVIRSNAKKYYYFVIFYIVSKMVLCIFLQVKIITGIPYQFEDIESQTIQKIFDNSLAFADCSIVQLFLISFEHYIALSFSIFGSKKTEQLIRILMQGVQLVTFFTLIIPILLFNINIMSYQTLNIFTMTLNCLSVIVFIAAFFFMNFKMTGLMIDKRSSEIIKKVYTLLLTILISRLIMSVIQVWVEINITNGSFQDFITIIQQNQNQYVVLGFCFIVYLLIMLLTQGLPLIMSLRQSVSTVLAEVIRPVSRPASFQQSVITQSNTDIKEQLLNNLDISSDGQISSPIRQNNQNQNYYGVSRIENPDELQIIEKIVAVKEDFISFKAKWAKNNKLYFVKKLGNISNYIIEDILNQIQQCKKYDIKVINPIKVLQNNNQNKIYIIQKYFSESLQKRIQNAISLPLKQKLNLSIKIALAIGRLHELPKIAGHGSLNPKNIMFDENENIVFTGFGMESLKKYLSLTCDYSNITMYTAVQLFGSARQKTIHKPQKPADVYSFGIIFYELITGNFKYRNLSLAQIRDKFQKQDTRPKIPQQMQQDIKKLMRKCWQQNPQNRPPISSVIASLQSIKSHI